MPSLFRWQKINIHRIKVLMIFRLYSVQSLSRVRLFVTPWTATRQASLSITNSRSYPDSCPLSWWRHLTISSSVVPFSCLQSCSSHQVARVLEFPGSTSVLPMNTQDWSPLGWTGWISLQSRGLSRVFSNTQLKSINSSALSFLYSPTLTSIHDYWTNHSFD